MHRSYSQTNVRAKCQYIQNAGHVVCDHAAVPCKTATSGSAVPPEIRVQATVLSRKRLDLRRKGQQPSAEMAVEEQHGLPSTFILCSYRWSNRFYSVTDF